MFYEDGVDELMELKNDGSATCDLDYLELSYCDSGIANSSGSILKLQLKSKDGCNEEPNDRERLDLKDNFEFGSESGLNYDCEQFMTINPPIT